MGWDGWSEERKEENKRGGERGTTGQRARAKIVQKVRVRKKDLVIRSTPFLGPLRPSLRYGWMDALGRQIDHQHIPSLYLSLAPSPSL